MRVEGIALTFFLSFFAGVLTAQDSSKDQNPDQKHNQARDQNVGREKSGFMDKVFFGGGIGAGFGDYTYVSVSPIIGYRVSPKLTTGLRLMYQYTTFAYYNNSTRDYEDYSGHDYSIGGFVTYSLFGPIFIQGEYEHLNYDGLYYDGTSMRTTFNSILAGGGISQPVGRKAGIFLVLLYNFSYANYDSTNAYRSPYNSPWVMRVGITGGF